MTRMKLCPSTNTTTILIAFPGTDPKPSVPPNKVTILSYHWKKNCVLTQICQCMVKAHTPAMANKANTKLDAHTDAIVRSLLPHWFTSLNPSVKMVWLWTRAPRFVSMEQLSLATQVTLVQHYEQSFEIAASIRDVMFAKSKINWLINIVLSYKNPIINLLNRMDGNVLIISLDSRNGAANYARNWRKLLSKHMP